MKGEYQLLYFDNAATSWPKPENVYATHDFVLRQGGNAGRGVNQVSLAAGRELYKARQVVANLFNIANPERVIFTQNVTEALNTGLQGILRPGDHVLISSLEHNAVVRPLEYLCGLGVSYSVVPCTPEGFLNLSQLKKRRCPQTKLLVFTHASNVLGSIMPLSEIGSFAKEEGLVFMVDAAQSAGVLPIDVEQMKIDFLAFTGHKGLYGPPGSGGFYAAMHLDIKPLLYGGTGSHSAMLTQPLQWPESMESGTRNLPALAGLRAGIEFIQETGLAKIREHELRLTDLLLSGLQELPGVKILGPDKAVQRVGLVSCTFAGMNPDQVANILDREYGIIVRSGLHCAPLAHETAGTLKEGALRISPGYFQRKTDIETLLDALKRILTGRSSSV